jgi:DNA-binding NarL/FixJ family response regulator
VSVRVVIADDQALVRGGFRMILDSRPDIEVVGEAEDGEQALMMVERHDPDVVLMDVRMPNVDGIEGTRRIVGSGSGARIIILTTYDLDEYVFAALRAGASGFLLKDVRPPDLVEGVRVVARGDALLAASVTRRLLDRFAGSLPVSPIPPPDLEELTDRELEVLLSLLISLAVTVLGMAILLVRDLPTPEAGELAAQIGPNAVVAMLFGALGVGIGAAVRNQVVAVVAMLAVLFVVEPVLIGLAPEVGRYGPFVALPTAAAGIPEADAGLQGVDLLAPAVAMGLMLAWIGAAFAAGAALLRSRDVD